MTFPTPGMGYLANPCHLWVAMFLPNGRMAAHKSGTLKSEVFLLYAGHHLWHVCFGWLLLHDCMKIFLEDEPK